MNKKMNLKLRFKNKIVLGALLTTIVTLVYQVLSIAGVTPPVSESQVVEWIGIVLNALVVLGVLTDPTTAGVGDTSQVMEYTEPRKE
jgi:phi LC3 family holin